MKYTVTIKAPSAVLFTIFPRRKSACVARFFPVSSDPTKLLFWCQTIEFKYYFFLIINDEMKI